MATIKDRKVFAFNNFRGLDKENKPLKVAPFRASDGYNFIIDSDTLKTRPGVIKENTIIASYLENNEVVLDYYDFKGSTVYITNLHFRVVFGSSQYKEDHVKFITGGLPTTIDWSGKKPIFKEEKDVLFIFGLDKVYVYNIFADGTLNQIFLYDIAKKPTNPFDTTVEEYTLFEDFPKSYVPTIYIGDNAFEDLNNLSNSYKYQLFAEANAFTDDGFNTYYLPTTYEESKHASYLFDIKFYEDRFGDIEALPFFLGVNNENFEYDSTDPNDVAEYGSILNLSSAIPVIDTFFPAADFEYKVVGGVTTTVKQVIGLDKKTFFNLRTSEENQNVFEFTLNYLKTQNISWSVNQNKILLFALPLEYNAIYKDGDDTIIEIVREQATQIVYIQLRKYDDTQLYTVNDGIVQTSATNTNPSGYASFSTNQQSQAVPGTSPSQTYFIDNLYNVSPSVASPIVITGVPLNNFNSNYAQQQARSWLLQQDMSSVSTDQNNPSYARVGVRLRRSETSTSSNSFDLDYPSFDATGSGYISDSAYPYSWSTDDSTYPFNSINSGTDQVYTMSTINSYSEGLTSTEIQSKLQQFLAGVDLPSGNSGTIAIKVPVVIIDYYNNFQPFIWQGQKVVYYFSFTKGETVTTYYHSSFVYQAKLFQTGQEIISNLYDLQVSTKFPNNFELKVRDLFFDYSQEPSINVTITHQLNPDYDLIAKSKFGIAFGSENRFFLAGNPDYPNIDRYNVSNDLLGNNVKSQSYELSYFPSKNYRVVGGKGAINGYVIATDSQLYVTKVDYPNDDKLFIRERILDENGVVGYREFKTNISKTPINERCIVRFYNDILILSKDGLYAIEISSNVLTNERLLKLRSGFINKDLKASLLSAVNDPFILENNYYMYIVIDKTIYVADSRYVAVNENGMIDNQSYEIVKWNFDLAFKNGKITETDVYFLDETYGIVYTLLENNNEDQSLTPIPNGGHTTVNIGGTTTEYAHTFTSELNDLFYENPEKYSFTFSGGYRFVAAGNAFDYENNVVTVTDSSLFTDIVDGTKLSVLQSDGVTFYDFVVTGFEASNRTSFSIPIEYTGTPSAIYRSLTDGSYYIVQKYIYNGGKYFVLNFYEPDSVEDLGTLTTTLPNSRFIRNQMYQSQGKANFYSEDKLIKFLWASNVTDFGNNLQEKTMFRLNVYATKQADNNFINVGYKTMRRLKQASDSNSVRVTDQIDLSNPNDFDEVNFLFYAINTFNEMGTSIPAKENNFLHIQFLVTGEGAIELNAIEVIYKNNRMLKSIG